MYPERGICGICKNPSSEQTRCKHTYHSSCLIHSDCYKCPTCAREIVLSERKERTLTECFLRSVNRFMGYMLTTSEDCDTIDRLINMLSRLDPNARERISMYSTSGASFIRKKEDIYISLRNPEGYMYPMSTLNYIVIHLYALSITPDFGDITTFCNNKKALTRIALEIGIAYPICDEHGTIPHHIQKMMFNIA